MNTRHQTYSQAEVDAWNLAHPVGTACRYEDGPGKWVPTITRSEAWLLGHGVPVVKIEGKSGGYGIDCLSFPDLAEHYRTILQTIEGVIGTPPGTETDLNTLPERVAKAVVRVPDSELTPDPELLWTLPPEVKDAALFLDNWMKANGHTRWALYGIQSRVPASISTEIRPGYYKITKNHSKDVSGSDFGEVREFGNGVLFLDTNDGEEMVTVSELLADGWKFTRFVEEGQA